MAVAWDSPAIGTPHSHQGTPHRDALGTGVCGPHGISDHCFPHSLKPWNGSSMKAGLTARLTSESIPSTALGR